MNATELPSYISLQLSYPHVNCCIVWVGVFRWTLMAFSQNVYNAEPLEIRVIYFWRPLAFFEVFLKVFSEVQSWFICPLTHLNCSVLHLISMKCLWIPIWFITHCIPLQSFRGSLFANHMLGKNIFMWDFNVTKISWQRFSINLWSHAYSAMWDFAILHNPEVAKSLHVITAALFSDILKELFQCLLL